MGCPAKCKLGNTLTFAICTHDPATGVLTDADVNPLYRIYEGENAPAMLIGNMSKLDDANTTGFYTGNIPISTLRGYSIGKTYTIYIEAEIGGDRGGISYAFKVLTGWQTSEIKGFEVLSGQLVVIKGEIQIT